MKYLYHITDKENLSSIFTNGLKPAIGENSKLCGTEYEFVYLTDYHSIPYWQIILQKPIILQITNLDIPNIDCYHYGIYTEYCMGHTIPPSQIKLSHISFTKAKRTQVMKELCTQFLASISHICRTFAMHYEYGTEYGLDIEDYIRYLKVHQTMLSRLNYNTLTNFEIQQALLEQTDGDYGFTDTYKNTHIRLWEQLIHYPKDKSYTMRQGLYDFINQTFPNSIKYMNTGGWTG